MEKVPSLLPSRRSASTKEVLEKLSVGYNVLKNCHIQSWSGSLHEQGEGADVTSSRMKEQISETKMLLQCTIGICSAPEDREAHCLCRWKSRALEGVGNMRVLIETYWATRRTFWQCQCQMLKRRVARWRMISRRYSGSLLVYTFSLGSQMLCLKGFSTAQRSRGELTGGNLLYEVQAGE